MSFTYRGLKAKLDRYLVTDKDVDSQIERLQQQNPRIAIITDRPTENGDEVVLDYAGFCDGVQFPGGTAENQTLVLGSGMFIPGFEEQLLDKVCEEKVIVKVNRLNTMDLMEDLGIESAVSGQLEDWQKKEREMILEHNVFTIRTNALLSSMGTLVQYAAMGYCIWRLWQGRMILDTMTFFLQQRGTLQNAS